jgi:hypothetical protein
LLRRATAPRRNLGVLLFVEMLDREPAVKLAIPPQRHLTAELLNLTVPP